jgi:hypothetical protein
MTDNVRVTVRIPAALEVEFMQRVVTEGYGMRGKSKWVAEAVEMFLELEDIVEYVEYGEELDDAEKDKVQAFYFNKKLIDKLTDGVIKVRRELPTIEGVKSLIIRSSIIQRLFRNNKTTSGTQSPISLTN